MMCCERFGGRTSWDCLQNRRLHFQKSAVLEDAPRRVAQIEEMTLAHVAMRGNAAGCTKGLAFLKFFAHLRNRSGYLKAAAEWLDAFCTKRVEFFAPQRD